MTNAISPKTRKSIEVTLRDGLTPQGFVRVEEIRAGEDHDGEEILDIDVVFGRPASGFDGRAALETLARLRKRLLAAGEQRFPHVRYRFPEDGEPTKGNRAA